jgi:hypothetical protein
VGFEPEITGYMLGPQQYGVVNFMVFYVPSYCGFSGVFKERHIKLSKYELASDCFEIGLGLIENTSHRYYKYLSDLHENYHS